VPEPLKFDGKKPPKFGAILGKREIWGSTEQPKHAVASCCCYLANTNKKFEQSLRDARKPIAFPVQ